MKISFIMTTALAIAYAVSPLTTSAFAASKAASKTQSTSETSPVNDKSEVYMYSPYPGIILRKGSRGQDVAAIQQRLNDLGVSAGPVDGDFGPLTRHAVLQFQRAHHLTADGVVGPITWSDLFPTSNSPILRNIQQFANTRDSRVSVAVYDANHHQTYVYNPLGTFDTASIVKTLILATLLYQAQQHQTPLSSQVRQIADPMIEQSNNDAATTLWDLAGQSSGTGAFASLAGLDSTVPNPYGYWGLTTTSALDQVKLIKDFAFSNPLLTSASRQYALGLMHNVVSWQRWGVSAGVPNSAYLAIKNGWLPLTSGWEINSTGYVDGDGRNYVIAVLTDHNATEQYGISSIEGVSKIVWTDLNPTSTETSQSNSDVQEQ